MEGRPILTGSNLRGLTPLNVGPPKMRALMFFELQNLSDLAMRLGSG